MNTARPYHVIVGTGGKHFELKKSMIVNLIKIQFSFRSLPYQSLEIQA